MTQAEGPLFGTMKVTILFIGLFTAALWTVPLLLLRLFILKDEYTAAYIGVLSWAVIINGLTLMINILDKVLARCNCDSRRLPECLLHCFTLLGGGPATVLAMFLFCHKLKRGRYQIKFIVFACFSILFIFVAYGLGYGLQWYFDTYYVRPFKGATNATPNKLQTTMTTETYNFEITSSAMATGLNELEISSSAQTTSLGSFQTSTVMFATREDLQASTVISTNGSTLIDQATFPVVATTNNFFTTFQRNDDQSTLPPAGFPTSSPLLTKILSSTTRHDVTSNLLTADTTQSTSENLISFESSMPSTASNGPIANVTNASAVMI